MRFVLLLLVVLGLVGCGQKQSEKGSSREQSQGGNQQRPESETNESVSYVGDYVGVIFNRDINPASQLPPSMSEVIGDGTLSLYEEGRFRMMHLGYEVSGTYEVAGKQLVLNVEQMEGLTKDAIGDVDLAANKKAGRLPSSKEQLETFTKVMVATDWRFDIEEGKFVQVGDANSTPLYEFKPKPS